MTRGLEHTGPKVENPYQSPTESVESKPRSSQPDAEPWSVWATRDTIFPRHIAALLDNIAAVALGVVAAKQLPEDQVIAQLAVCIAVSLSFFLLLESIFACTPGKLLTGLVVVDMHGRRCSWRQSLLRTVLRLLEMNPLFLGWIIAAISIVSTRNHQRIGDRLAKTLVIPRRRMPKG